MFTHLTTITPVELKTIENSSGRYYITPTGNKYPSVTTVIGSETKQWLTDWRNMLGPVKADKETKRAGDRGTAVHLMAERFLKNDPNPTANQKIEYISEFNSLRLFLRKINNIYTQETPLWSDTLKLAGRVDCVAEYNGVLSIIDFKTSSTSKNQQMIENYWLQTTAYAIMFQELYDIKIDQAVLIMSVERGAVPLVFKQNIDDYIPALVQRINNYYSTHKVQQ